MEFSKFGQKFTLKSGILQLMDDLGKLPDAEHPLNMLGGGNPAIIPAINQTFQQSFAQLGDGFLTSANTYSSPQGDDAFINALAGFLNRQGHRDISRKNIALTNGSQTAFFYLFNLLSGQYRDAHHKKILLPLAPEYVGYANVHMDGEHFVANRPQIQASTYTDSAGNTHTGFFKYHIDFSRLQIDESIAAICCSRPTNPTGNVLDDQEIDKLSALSIKHHIPLIIDNAYGQPFPNILFSQANFHWQPHIIMCLSLSKIGLPGLRTGIIIANETIIAAIASLNAVISLAPNRFGAALMTPLLESDVIQTMTTQEIQPFYRRKVDFTITHLKATFGDTPLKIHKPQGAIFLWLWFPDLPISSIDLYQQLKVAGTIVVPGEYFFPGMDISDYAHAHECIRISYAQSDEVLLKGIADIARLVKKAYGK